MQMEIEARRCGKCGERRSPHEFYDLSVWCKECMKEYGRQRRLKATLALKPPEAEGGRGRDRSVIR
jgi:hypothetical protein